MKTSKIMITLAGILVATAAFTDDCDAQRRGFGGMRGGFGGQQNVSEMSLLAMKEVIQHLNDELGLEEETMEKISEMAKEIREEINEERRAIMQDFRNMSEDERQEAMEKLQKIAKKLNSESFKKVKKMLDKKHLKRLGELRMQRMGIAVLQDSLVQVVLEFTKEQTEKITAVQESFDKSRQKMMEDTRSQMQGGGDREAMREAMTEMRESMTEMQQTFEKETLGVLSDDQKKILDELKGEEFEFPRRQGRRQRDR